MSRKEISNPEDYLYAERRSKEWFLNRFERSFEKLPNNETELNPSEVKFFGTKPEFYTAVVLRDLGNHFEILVNENPKRGYKLMDHYEILQQHGLASDHDKEFNTFLFVSEGKRYLLGLGIEVLNLDRYKEKLKKVIDTLKRYRIEVVFSLDFGRDIYKMKPEAEIIAGEYIRNFDKMVFDDWTYGMAEHHKWTVFDWLRFRLAMQTPEKNAKRG